MRVDRLDDYWDFQISISGPIAAVLATLSTDEHNLVRGAFRAAAETYGADFGYQLPFRAIIVHATR